MPTAPYLLVMESLLAFFGSLAEPGRLALMGFSLISVALVLRKVFFPNPSPLNASTKASAQAR
jgi:hypothetical protein